MDPRGNCLQFQTALEIAQGTEAAMKNSKSLNEGEPRVNALAKVCTGVVKEPIMRKSAAIEMLPAITGKVGHLAQVRYFRGFTFS